MAKKLQLLIFTIILLCMTGCFKDKYNTIYSRCSQTGDLAIAEIETGYFYLYNDILYYADKTDMSVWVPVCNKLECPHTPELSLETGKCNAKIENGTFVEKDGKLYTMGNSFGTELESGFYVYEILQDGSGLKAVYKIPLESNDIPEYREMVLQNCFVLYYKYLDERGMYQYRLARLEEDGSVYNLYSYESELDEGSSHYTINELGIIRGGNVIDSAFLSRCFGFEVSVDTNILWRVDGDTPEQFILPNEEVYIQSRTYAYSYLSGDYLVYGKPGDGYYKLNLKTNENEFLQECYKEDGKGMVINEQYFVETNLYTGEDVESPYIAYFDGEKWTDVEVPEELTKLNCVLKIKALGSDRIFMQAVQKYTSFAPIYLYYIMLDEESPKLLPAAKMGEIITKEEANNNASGLEDGEEIVTPLGLGDVEEIVLYDNDTFSVKLTDIEIVDRQNDKELEQYLRCHYKYELKREIAEEGRVGIRIDSCSVNGLQSGNGTEFRIESNMEYSGEKVFEFQLQTNFGNGIGSGKLNSKIKWLREYFDISDLTQFNIYFSASLVEYLEDGTKYKEEFENVVVDIYPYGKESIVQYSREEEKNEKVVFDNEIAKMTFLGYDTYEIQNDMMYFFVENKTDEAFALYFSDAYVNGISILGELESLQFQSINQTYINGHSGAYVRLCLTDHDMYNKEIEDVIKEITIKMNFNHNFSWKEENIFWEEEVILNPTSN